MDSSKFEQILRHYIQIFNRILQCPIDAPTKCTVQVRNGRDQPKFKWILYAHHKHCRGNYHHR